MSNTPDKIQPVIDEAVKVIPAAKVAGAKAWFKRYLKGEIALVGTLASLALTYLPPGGSLAHWAAVVVSAVTVVGVVEARNGI